MRDEWVCMSWGEGVVCEVPDCMPKCTGLGVIGDTGLCDGECRDA